MSLHGKSFVSSSSTLVEGLELLQKPMEDLVTSAFPMADPEEADLQRRLKDTGFRKNSYRPSTFYLDQVYLRKGIDPPNDFWGEKNPTVPLISLFGDEAGAGSRVEKHSPWTSTSSCEVSTGSQGSGCGLSIVVYGFFMQNLALMSTF